LTDILSSGKTRIQEICMGRWQAPGMIVLFLIFIAAYGVSQSVESSVNEVPVGFAEIEMGMELDQVKELLKRDPQFKFRGDPDVSLLTSPNESLIETEGISFIDRAYFQFHEGKLYTIILALDPDRVDHYTMYTTLVGRYGEPTSLDPSEAVWEFDALRLALERPLSVKYVDSATFNDILRENAKLESLNALNRDQFLGQF
jgi:hypothetical protein